MFVVLYRSKSIKRRPC